MHSRHSVPARPASAFRSQGAASQGPVETIVVGVEGSTQELVVHQHAIELAAGLGVPVRLVHVESGPKDPPDDVTHYARRLARERHVALDYVIVHARDVVAGLVDEAGPSDLIVTGTRLAGTEYHDESITERLIRDAPCPVHVVRLM